MLLLLMCNQFTDVSNISVELVFRKNVFNNTFGYEKETRKKSQICGTLAIICLHSVQLN